MWIDYISYTLLPVAFVGKDWEPQFNIILVKPNKKINRDEKENHRKTLKLKKIGLRETAMFCHVKYFRLTDY